MKRDSATGAALSGAVFQLTQNGVPVATVTSGTDGAVRFPALAAGTYTLTETVSPAGYPPHTATYTVVVDAVGNVLVDGQPASRFQVLNTRTPSPQPGSLTLVKYDVTTGARLAGAYFELRSGSAAVATTVSNSDGLVIFTDLTPGTYTLVETQPPAGYIAAGSSQTVVVAADGSITVDGFAAELASIGNTPVNATGLHVLTQNSAGQPLTGSTWRLLQGAATVQVVTSGIDGIASFTQPAAGSYTLLQTSAPVGYQYSDTSHIVTVDTNGIITIDGAVTNTLTVINQPLANAVTFSKTDAVTGAPLAGAAFTLTSAASGTLNAVSSGEGRVNFGTVLAGDYVLQETTPPAGYQLDTVTRTVVVATDGTVTVDGAPIVSYAFPNTPMGGTYTIEPASAESPLPPVSTASQPLSADHAELDAPEPEAASAVPVSAVRQPEPADHAAVSTDSAPEEPAECSRNTPEANASEPAQAPAASPSMSPQPYLSLRQVNRAGQTLAGAKWELRHNGSAFQTVQTAEDGTARFSAPEPGVYTLRETHAVPGYLVQKAEHTLSVDSDGALRVDGSLSPSLTVVSASAPRQLSFAVTDGQGGWPVHRAEFRLMSESGTLEDCSDHNGRVRFGPLQPGSYRLHCVVSAPGYAKPAGEWSVQVTEDGGVSVENHPAETFGVTLQPLLTGFTFRVADGQTGAPLEGTAFTLGDRPILTAVSDEEGVVSFEGVYYGYHTLSETQAAAGYRTDSARLPVNVSDRGHVLIDGVPAENYVYECLPEEAL